MTKTQELEVQEKKEITSKEEKTFPSRYFVPVTDIFETDDAFTVVMETPGVEKKDLDVQVEGGTVRVEGKINFLKYEGLEPLYSEYNVGHFARTFSMPNQIDAQRINASLEDGVLTLKLSKVEQARPRRIPIG